MEDSKRDATPTPPINYYNGFSIHPNPADMQVVFLLNGLPQECVVLSHITIKNLANKLLEVVNTFEKETEFFIPDFDELDRKLIKENIKEDEA